MKYVVYYHTTKGNELKYDFKFSTFEAAHLFAKELVFSGYNRADQAWVAIDDTGTVVFYFDATQD